MASGSFPDSRRHARRVALRSWKFASRHCSLRGTKDRSELSALTAAADCVPLGDRMAVVARRYLFLMLGLKVSLQL